MSNNPFQALSVHEDNEEIAPPNTSNENGQANVNNVPLEEDQTSHNENWGDSAPPASEYEEAGSNNRHAKSYEGKSKNRFLTLREAVSRAFERNPVIYGHTFDRNYPLISMDIWTQACEEHSLFGTKDYEQAIVKVSSSYPMMEENDAIDFVSQLVIDGLLDSLAFYEKKAKRAREIYNQAVEIANNRK